MEGSKHFYYIEIFSKYILVVEVLYPVLIRDKNNNYEFRKSTELKLEDLNKQ